MWACKDTPPFEFPIPMRGNEFMEFPDKPKSAAGSRSP